MVTADELLADIVKTWSGNSPEPFLRALERAMRYLNGRDRLAAARDVARSNTPGAEADPPNLHRRRRGEETNQ